MTFLQAKTNILFSSQRLSALKIIMLCLVKILTAAILALFCSIPAMSASSAENYSDMAQSKVRCKDRADCDAAIEAIGRAENFFKQYGYVFNQSVKVQFKKSMSIALNGNSLKQQGLHGLYNAATGWCEVPHWQVQSTKKVFGFFDMTKEFHLSIITHEAAHRLYHLILSRRNQVVGVALHEFVAYVTQIHTMKEPEKTKVLKLWPGEVLSDTEHINTFAWASNPNRFAIMAYRFFLNYPQIMKDILDGKVKSDDNKLFRFFHEFKVE